MSERIMVTKYQGVPQIRKMIENEDYIEAFTHTLHSIERILWNKIVGCFSGETATQVRRRIDESRDEANRHFVSTKELIEWAYIMGAISREERTELAAFNKSRNEIVHRHGGWAKSKELFNGDLEKGMRFIEQNES